MLRLTDPQLTLWEELLPPELKVLSTELQKVDELLDDDRFLGPFAERFRTTMGRPTVPIETYLRLMYLKHRYGLGYETLVQEVSDSIKWRRFCRLSLDARVPHSTTLIKLTKRFGPEVLEELNRLVVEKAREEKLIRGRKLRVDSTVVEADIHYPTDAGLLADGVRVITRTVRKLRDAGAALRTEFRNRTRSIKKRIVEISKVLRRRTGEAYQEVRNITGEIMETTKQVIKNAEKVLKNAKHYAWRTGSKKVRVLTRKLEEAIKLTKQVVGQTEQVQEGNHHIPNRLVSLFDPEARPIRKGKLKSPTEFGRKVLVQETEERIITGYQVHTGNPADESLLQEAIADHQKVFGRPPWAVATDRGFGSKANEQFLKDQGVKRISLPRKGRKSKARLQYEKQPWFRRLQRWRSGGEGTIGILKRGYGLRRSRLKGTDGTRIWVGFGIMAYNLRRLATLS